MLWRLQSTACFWKSGNCTSLPALLSWAFLQRQQSVPSSAVRRVPLPSARPKECHKPIQTHPARSSPPCLSLRAAEPLRPGASSLCLASGMDASWKLDFAQFLAFTMRIPCVTRNLVVDATFIVSNI